MKTDTSAVVITSAEVAAATITNAHVSAATAVPVLTPTTDTGLVKFNNTTNVELIATINGVQITRVAAGSRTDFSLVENLARLKPGTVFGVFANSGSLPASGVFEVVAVPV